ncbi:glycosyltransferase family 4 protein [Thermodesulfobacteriota bacterium]
MKILMLADVFFPDTVGGAGRVIYHLGLELSAKGHETHIITRNMGGKFLSYQQFDSNLFAHRFFIPQKESINLFLMEIKNSYSVLKQLYREIQFDIVCIHQSMVAIGPSLSNCCKNIPAIYYFHSPWHEEFLVKKSDGNRRSRKRDRLIAYIMRCIEKRLLLRTSNIVVLSRFMRDKILSIHKYPKNKITIIPGGIDLKNFQLPGKGKTPIKQRADFPSDKTIFLTVRNLVPRMGLENLIEAFSQSDTLRQKGLLLIGGKGFLEDRLKTMVDNLNLKKTIRFLGHIPDESLPKIYQTADFFILPTEKLEGFGLVILESMACGTPVLGTPVGAIPEVIGPFDKKLIFDGTGWEDLKKKMEEVVERPDDYSFDPKACRKFIEENYSWKKVADHFETIAIRLVRS